MTNRSNGTQAAVINTEHTLYNETTDNLILQLTVDLSNMVAGDIVELRVKEKVLSGGSTAQALMATFAHVQANPVAKSIPLPCAYDGTFTLKQTAGTGRNYPWRVDSI